MLCFLLRHCFAFLLLIHPAFVPLSFFAYVFLQSLQCIPVALPVVHEAQKFKSVYPKTRL